MRQRIVISVVHTFTIFLIFIIIASVAYSGPGNDVRKARVRRNIPNQAIICMGPGKSVIKYMREIKGSIVKSIPGRNTYLITFPDSLAVDKVVGRLHRKGDVILAQPNYVLNLPEVENLDDFSPDGDKPVYSAGTSPGPYYGQQAAGGSGIDSAGLLATGENVVAAIIDNGIDFTHPLFDSSFENNGYDFVDNDSNASEESGDMFGHGTFVSGLVKLIAPDCKLVPLRAFNESGVGTCFDISDAIYRAISDSVDIINMSFSTDQSDTLLAEAVTDARLAGITLVSSSGNDSSHLATYPAAYTGVIAVSAIDSTEYLTSWSNHGSYIDVCAPGKDVYSSLPGQYQWGTWSGTSFAAAQISGICALIIELRPNYGGSDVDSHVRLTARKNLLWGTVTPPDSSYGYGCGNPYRATLYLRRGDVDGSGLVDSLDIDYLSDYINKGGPAPIPIYQLGDVNCSGTINTLDVSYIVNYLYSGGPAPGCIY